MKLNYRNYLYYLALLIFGCLLGITLANYQLQPEIRLTKLESISLATKLEQLKPQYPFVVAKKEIKIGEIITSENMAIRMFPEIGKHSNAITPTDFKQVDGMILTNPLASGEMLMRSMISAPKKTISKQIKGKQTIVTVKVPTTLEAVREPTPVITQIPEKGRLNGPWDLLIQLIKAPEILAIGSAALGTFFILIHLISKKGSEISILWGLAKYQKIADEQLNDLTPKTGFSFLWGLVELQRYSTNLYMMPDEIYFSIFWGLFKIKYNSKLKGLNQ